MAGLEDHREHLLPHFERRDDLAENLTFARHLFVRFVATFEFCAIGLMEELFDIVVPGLEVGAAGAATLSALVHCDQLVVV